MRFSQYCHARQFNEMDEGMALQRAIANHPTDSTPWGVYADWLDEHDDPVRAHLARLMMRVVSGDAVGVAEEALRTAGRPLRSGGSYYTNIDWHQLMSGQFHCFTEAWAGMSAEMRAPFALPFHMEVNLGDEIDGWHPEWVTVLVDPGLTTLPGALIDVLDADGNEMDGFDRNRAREQVREALENAGWNPRTDHVVWGYMRFTGAEPVLDAAV